MATTKLVIRRQYEPATSDTPTVVHIIRFNGESFTMNLNASNDEAWNAEIEASKAGMMPKSEANFIGGNEINIATWTI